MNWVVPAMLGTRYGLAPGSPGPIGRVCEAISHSLFGLSSYHVLTSQARSLLSPHYGPWPPPPQRLLQPWPLQSRTFLIDGLDITSRILVLWWHLLFVRNFPGTSQYF